MSKDNARLCFDLFVKHNLVSAAKDDKEMKAKLNAVTVTPKQLVPVLGVKKAFDVREALRAARREGNIDHEMRTRWNLPLAEVINLFGDRLVPPTEKKVKKAKGAKKATTEVAAPVEPAAPAAENTDQPITAAA